MKKEKNCISGIFRANEKGFGFVKPVEGEEQPEIYIASSNTHHALNGDEVLVKTEENEQKESNKKQEGKIIKILKHETDIVVGLFKNSKSFGFVIPDDKRLGTDIFISKKYFSGAKNNQKVVVKLTKYPEKGKNAEGKIIEIIGHIDQAGVDMMSLVREYDLPYEFSENVIQEAKSIKQEISKKDIPHRLDLRQEEIFTIDGEDAKDLDDAVCVKKLQNGNYELGVHIADVSYYVKEESLLDQEAVLRGTSVYMLDRVIPMLPKELSNGICSLNANEDRFALSVIMQINQKGEVISSDIRKTIIHVTKRMNYHDVATILENNIEKQEILDRYKPYIEHFKTMEELAHILKQRRQKEGSLNLDIPESKIILDKNGIAIDVQKYELSFANEIIEQFMLIANETVAEKFYWLEAPFIYRVHEVPDYDKVQELNKFLYNLGYKIKCSKDNIYPKAFAEVLEEVKGKPEERVVSNLILHTLKVARYESFNDGHFGIASKYYCHFTSPIRRYPDLFIHRVISKYLTNGYNVEEKELEKYQAKAEKYAISSSEREKIAQKVERDSQDIKKAEYMQDKVGKEYDGIISSITSFGIFVELDNTIEGLIRFEGLGDEYFIYDEERKTLLGERSKIIYKIGDKIHIRVIKADKQARQIDFEKVQEEQTNEVEP